MKNQAFFQATVKIRDQQTYGYLTLLLRRVLLIDAPGLPQMGIDLPVLNVEFWFFNLLAIEQKTMKGSQLVKIVKRIYSVMFCNFVAYWWLIERKKTH